MAFPSASHLSAKGRCVGPNLWARAMQDVEKKRGMLAPRAAEELRTASRLNSGDTSTQGSLSEVSSCSATDRPQTVSLGTQERSCSNCSWRRLPLLRRINTRPSYAAVLLFLASAFSLRGWRAAMMIESPPFGVVRWSTSSDRVRVDEDEGSNQCRWEPSGSLMFNMQHTKQHADASHWFHVAECFIGRRAEFKEQFAGMAGTDVYLKDSDTTWTSKLTPMTRLLLVAGLTTVGVREVHFVDGNHATFSFPADPAPSSAPTSAGEGGSSKLRGVIDGDTGGSEGAARPRPGQVGVLRIDDVGHKSQFVVSTEQPLPYRLAVSAPVAPARWDGWDGRGVGGTVDGGRGGGTRECVKFVANVGTWGQKRVKWFPAEEDPRELLRALDNFCPISWLREEDEKKRLEEEAEKAGIDDGDEDNGTPVESPLPGRGSRDLFATVVGGPGRGRAAGAGAGLRQFKAEPRNLIIYQRDRNRRLLNTEEVADELWIRLGHLGWTVTEIVHDSEQHPCELIDQLARADVLLTAHGFQSMLSLFMAPGSVLFEVYPHKYFKMGYAPVAHSLGLRYAFSESPPLLPLTSWSWPSVQTCMEWYLCRWYTRKSDVVLDEDNLEVLISLMLKSLRY